MEIPRLFSQVQQQGSAPPPPTPANPYQYTPGATIGPGSSYGTKTYNSSTGGSSNIYLYPGGNPNFQEGPSVPGTTPVAPAQPPVQYNGPTFTPTPAVAPAAATQPAFQTPRQIKDAIRASWHQQPAPTPTPTPTPAPVPVQAPVTQMPQFDGLQNFLNSLISGQF